jgi:hypothetical protein
MSPSTQSLAEASAPLPPVEQSGRSRGDTGQSGGVGGWVANYTAQVTRRVKRLVRGTFGKKLASKIPF